MSQIQKPTAKNPYKPMLAMIFIAALSTTTSKKKEPRKRLNRALHFGHSNQSGNSSPEPPDRASFPPSDSLRFSLFGAQFFGGEGSNIWWKP